MILGSVRFVYSEPKLLSLLALILESSEESSHVFDGLGSLVSLGGVLLEVLLSVVDEIGDGLGALSGESDTGSLGVSKNLFSALRVARVDLWVDNLQESVVSGSDSVDGGRSGESLDLGDFELDVSGALVGTESDTEDSDEDEKLHLITEYSIRSKYLFIVVL